MKRMKISHTRFAVLPMGAALIFGSTLAHAGGDHHKQQPGTASKSSGQSMKQDKSMKKMSGDQSQQQLRQVSGKIAKIKQVEVRGANTKNTVVLLDTKKNNRRLVVDLGPTKSLSRDQLKVGTEIQVEGRPVQVRDHRFLVAKRFKTNGKMTQIDRKEQAMQHQRQNKQQAGESGETQPESTQ